MPDFKILMMGKDAGGGFQRDTKAGDSSHDILTLNVSNWSLYPTDKIVTLSAGDRSRPPVQT